MILLYIALLACSVCLFFIGKPYEEPEKEDCPTYSDMRQMEINIKEANKIISKQKT